MPNARAHHAPRAVVNVVCLLTCLLAWLVLSPTVRADPPRELRVNARLEVPLVATGGALWLVSELLKPQLAPRSCRVCGVNALDDRVHDALLWSNMLPAQRASDALLFGIVPVAAFGGVAALALGNRADNALGTDMLMLLEALVLTADLTQLVKYTVGRERPYAYTERTDFGEVLGRPDDYLSFFSGHTSITFTLATAAATTATLRGYKQAPWVWAIGMPLAALTGYLRMGADRHYFTDVLTGALVGSAVGFLVPWLHTLGTSRNSNMPSMLVSPPGTLTFSWVR